MAHRGAGKKAGFQADKVNNLHIATKRWIENYNDLAKGVPLVPNPVVWGYAKESEEHPPTDYEIPPKDYSLPEPASYRKEVGGVLVGYGGHVPRARDKVGGAPYGGVNDGSVRNRKLAQTFLQHGIDPPNYLSEARSKGKTDAETPMLWESGIKTGFGGHMPKAKDVVGVSVFSLERNHPENPWTHHYEDIDHDAIIFAESAPAGAPAPAPA